MMDLATLQLSKNYTNKKTPISVKELGAKGEETDDTDEILDAVEAAKDFERSLFFPRGIYLVRRGITLTDWDNCHIFGERGTIIRKKEAVTQELTEDASQDDTELHVEDASEFEEDSDVYIPLGNPHSDFYAKITDIDTDNDTITVESYNNFTAGLPEDVSSGEPISSTFSVLRLPEWDNYDIQNVTIENIEIDGNRTTGEEDMIHPQDDKWTLSALNIESTSSADNSLITLREVTVRNSTGDGISLQAGNKSKVLGCNIFNAHHNGIHLGTGHKETVLRDNFIEETNRHGVFWCGAVSRVIATGNTVNDTESAFSHSGGGDEGKTSIISDNIIDGVSDDGINISTWENAIVTDNIMTGLEQFGINAYDATQCTIRGNELSGFSSDSSIYGISMESANDSICMGNIIDVPDGETAILDTGESGCIIKDNVELE